MPVTQNIAPAGIPSAPNRVGSPRLRLVGQFIFPGAIAPPGVFVGSPTVAHTVPLYIAPVGWKDEPHVGEPTVSASSNAIEPSGIPPGGGVGVPRLTLEPEGPPRNYLIDRQTGVVYPWPVNHDTEDAVKTLGRRLTRSGISASGKLIATRKVFLNRQPTHPGPMHLILHGSMIDRAQDQYHTFVGFFNDGEDRTFDYIDASGDSYHIQVIQFDARRKAGADRADGSYFSYSLEVEVLEVNHGAYKGFVA